MQLVSEQRLIPVSPELGLENSDTKCCLLLAISVRGSQDHSSYAIETGEMGRFWVAMTPFSLFGRKSN
jgi:hypothetical protein